MLIQLFSSYASANGVHKPGDVIDVPDDEASQLIDGGYAVGVKEVETATASVKPETATAPKQKRTRRKKVKRESDSGNSTS